MLFRYLGIVLGIEFMFIICIIFMMFFNCYLELLGSFEYVVLEIFII